jgi:serine protease Do
MPPRINAMTCGAAQKTGWLLLVALALCGAPAAEHTVPPPQPAAVRRADLNEAFTKAAPASIADLKAMEQQVKELVRRVSPAVVAVEIDGSSGSGVIISTNGLVLTAGHVCGEANRNVRFTFADGKTARGKTLGLDADTDTGLMRITDRGFWPVASVGDLTQARPGDWVLALGHPGGFDLRRSLVVRLGRIIRLSSGVLQTDCTLSLGDSGGPLFDMNGRVIGVHSAINTSLAGNFHVPISEFYDGWEQLAKVTIRSEPRTLQAYLGAKGVDAMDGCRVSTVEENSPASKAGLKVGDVVTKVEGRGIKAAAVFARWVEEAEPGETLHLEVRRGEKLLTLAVKVGTAPKKSSPR